MAIFNFSRSAKVQPSKRRNSALDAAIQVQRVRLFQANAMTVSALDALRANPDPRVRDAVNAARELICGAVLALDPARLSDAAASAVHARKVSRGDY
jgi:hypothetical protein